MDRSQKLCASVCLYSLRCIKELLICNTRICVVDAVVPVTGLTFWFWSSRHRGTTTWSSLALNNHIHYQGSPSGVSRHAHPRWEEAHVHCCRWKCRVSLYWLSRCYGFTSWFLLCFNLISRKSERERWREWENQCVNWDVSVIRNICFDNKHSFQFLVWQGWSEYFAPYILNCGAYLTWKYI